MRNLWNSKGLVIRSAGIVALFSLIFVPINLHAQRARTVTTTNSVTTTTNSKVTTISKK